MIKGKSEYDKYLESFKKLFNAYDKAAQYVDLPEEIQFYVNKKRSWIERLSSPEFPVAFLGGFSAGKSTIINAILGEAILPEATKSYTAIPTLVKRGDGNRAVIFYLDEKAKQELKNLYIEELSKDLRKKTDEYSLLNGEDLVKKLDSDIAEAKKLGNFNEEKSFNGLKTLIADWNKLSGKIDISIEELPKYITEEYDDVLFVDRAVIYLMDTNIPENIVLVDLPGLGVVNQRHRKITKTYVENEAKAFVVSSKVFHLLEGEEIELLAEIHKQRPKVLQRAFWVINHWDSLNTQQRKEESANFEDKVKHRKFNVSLERVFKVSALNYLLLKLLQEGKLDSSQKLKEHLDNLQRSCGKIPESADEAGGYLDSIEEVRNFVQFRTKLFGYLEQTARTEFLEEAKGEYLELSSKLEDIFAPLHDSCKGKDPENLRNSFVASELSNRQQEYIKVLREIVVEQVKFLRTEILPDMVFWKDDDRKQLEEQIKNAIDNLDKRELKNELLKGLDLYSVLSRLPQKLEEKLSVAEQFRAQLQLLAEVNVVTVLQEFLTTLKNSGSLPSDLSRLLADKLGSRNISARLKGWCDVFLFEYGDRLNTLGQEALAGKIVNKNSGVSNQIGNNTPILDYNIVPAQTQPNHDGMQNKWGISSSSDTQHVDATIDFALSHYRNSLVEFVKEQQTQVNERTKRGIKNYFEELEKELLELFEAKRSDIAQVIMGKIMSEVDDKLATEVTKWKVIKDAYRIFSMGLD